MVQIYYNFQAAFMKENKTFCSSSSCNNSCTVVDAYKRSPPVFSDRFEDCIHIMAVQRIVETFDSQQGLSAKSILRDIQSSDHGYAQNPAEIVSVFSISYDTIILICTCINLCL